MTLHNRRTVNWAMGSVTVLSVVVGFIGWNQYHISHGIDQSFTGNLFLTMQLFTVNTSFDNAELPLMLDIARFAAPVVLVSAVLNFLIGQLYWAVNCIHIRIAYRDQYVFNTLNYYSVLLIQDILAHEPKSRIIVLDVNMAHPAEARLEKMGVKVLHKDPQIGKSLEYAQVHRAKFLLALSDVFQENLAFIKAATECISETATDPPHVFLRIEDIHHLRLYKEIAPGGKLNMHVFSVLQKYASYLVDNHSPDIGTPIEEDSPSVRVAIVGFDSLGQHLLLESARMYHFANLSKPEITVIDTDIERKLRGFRLSYPSIDQSLTFTPLSLTDFSRIQARPAFRRFRWSLSPCQAMPSTLLWPSGSVSSHVSQTETKRLCQ